MNSIMAPVAIQEPGNYHAKGPIPESRVAPVAGHGPMQANFSPYMDNGGTIAAIAGENFVVLAADTRLSLGYAILSRDNSKMSALTPKCYIASSGMNADITTLHKVLKMRAVQYQQKHGKDMSCHAAANLLSRTLYYKRFFPYYTFNLLVGVDNEGKGAVYKYDAIGNIEQVPYASAGSGSSLIQPFMDNQVGFKTHQIIENESRTVEETVEFMKDMFSSAGERDIYTGDAIEIAVITPEGAHIEKFALKDD